MARMAVQPTRAKTRIVKGDRVRVMKGKESGKEGSVTRVVRERSTLIVEGLNLVKKATRPSQKYPKGGLFDQEAGIPISNVMVVCGRCNKPTRIGIQGLSEGRKLRVCKRCGEALGKER